MINKNFANIKYNKNDLFKILITHSFSRINNQLLKENFYDLFIIH